MIQVLQGPRILNNNLTFKYILVTFLNSDGNSDLNTTSFSRWLCSFSFIWRLEGESGVGLPHSLAAFAAKNKLRPEPGRRWLASTRLPWQEKTAAAAVAKSQPSGLQSKFLMGEWNYSPLRRANSSSQSSSSRAGLGKLLPAPGWNKWNETSGAQQRGKAEKRQSWKANAD